MSIINVAYRIMILIAPGANSKNWLRIKKLVLIGWNRRRNVLIEHVSIITYNRNKL